MHNVIWVSTAPKHANGRKGMKLALAATATAESTDASKLVGKALVDAKVSLHSQINDTLT